MIVALEEAKRRLVALEDVLKELGNQLRIDEARERAQDLERETMVQDFWNDAEKSSKKLREIKHRFDASEHGGAPILGISKPVIKAHGSSDANAIKNAVRQAIYFVETGINTDIAVYAVDYDEKKLIAETEKIYNN